MIDNFLALLFHSRDYAHRAHLAAQTYGSHKALEKFYEELTELVDRLAEAYQGRHGLVTIPYIAADPQNSDPSAPISVLAAHLKMIEGLRDEAIGVDTPLQNIVDEVVGLYLSTAYKLTNLK